MDVLFLDIDGVLNGHDYSPDAESSTIRKECVVNLSRILTQSDCKVVIISAWRYMILGEAMTIKGFEYMLRTHGLAGIKDRIVGITRKDYESGQVENSTERADQITEWLGEHKEVSNYVVLDDLDLGHSLFHPFVQTDGKVGLTAQDVEKVLHIFKYGREKK